MTENGQTPAPLASGRHHARRLRVIAITVLILGMLGVGVVYWIAAGERDLPDDTLTAGYYKSQARKVEQLYGQQGLLVEEWSEDLKRPGPQACIIIVTATAIAGGCFYFARLMDFDGGEKR